MDEVPDARVLVLGVEANPSGVPDLAPWLVAQTQARGATMEGPHMSQEERDNEVGAAAYAKFVETLSGQPLRPWPPIVQRWENLPAYYRRAWIAALREGIDKDLEANRSTEP